MGPALLALLHSLQAVLRPWGPGFDDSHYGLAGRNEAGVMGEGEAPLCSLHFLELMTSL